MACVFHSGSTETMDYTPGSAVAAGTIVVIGTIVGVCHRSIAANELGALHITGGIYRGPATAAVAAAGVPAYYDPATGKFTATAGALTKFGTFVSVASGADVEIRALHQHTA